MNSQVAKPQVKMTGSQLAIALALLVWVCACISTPIWAYWFSDVVAKTIFCVLFGSIGVAFVWFGIPNLVRLFREARGSQMVATDGPPGVVPDLRGSTGPLAAVGKVPVHRLASGTYVVMSISSPSIQVVERDDTKFTYWCQDVMLTDGKEVVKAVLLSGEVKLFRLEVGRKYDFVNKDGWHTFVPVAD